ncbi:MAG TPA: hypothetical protein ENG01_00210 [Candidatus Aenigmarchaeota archaeon]|nr:hypothetical protein [Candidatus Aenigmarchaeota archaeon]HEX32823.1 hypothetical protein [Candidatus Aenigmarchaeota archaeon]
MALLTGGILALGGMGLYLGMEMADHSDHSTHSHHSEPTEPINNTIQHNISLEQLLVEEGIGPNTIWEENYPDGSGSEIYYINASVDGKGLENVLKYNFTLMENGVPFYFNTTNPWFNFTGLQPDVDYRIIVKIMETRQNTTNDIFRVINGGLISKIMRFNSEDLEKDSKFFLYHKNVGYYRWAFERMIPGLKRGVIIKRLPYMWVMYNVTGAPCAFPEYVDDLISMLDSNTTYQERPELLLKDFAIQYAVLREDQMHKAFVIARKHGIEKGYYSWMNADGWVDYLYNASGLLYPAVMITYKNETGNRTSVSFLIGYEGMYYVVYQGHYYGFGMFYSNGWYEVPLVGGGKLALASNWTGMQKIGQGRHVYGGVNGERGIQDHIRAMSYPITILKETSWNQSIMTVKIFSELMRGLFVGNEHDEMMFKKIIEMIGGITSAKELQNASLDRMYPGRITITGDRIQIAAGRN